MIRNGLESIPKVTIGVAVIARAGSRSGFMEYRREPRDVQSPTAGYSAVKLRRTPLEAIERGKLPLHAGLHFFLILGCFLSLALR
jgi:hypothetical protein